MGALPGGLRGMPMTYRENFVCAIRVDGKILRETGDTVYVPFSSEYEIRLKNLNARRVVAKVSVDGKDATGAGLIIGPNQSIDLERFIANGNLIQGNKFKFIQRSEEIEKHRGIEAEDGLIRVEYHAENIVEKKTILTEHIHNYHNRYPKWPKNYPNYPWDYAGPIYGNFLGGISKSSYDASDGGSILRSMNMNAAVGATGGINAMQETYNDAGITVPGALSTQQFTIGDYFPLETVGHVLVLRMKGIVSGNPVEKPITVDIKPQCVTCGKRNKATNKFCSECGTALLLI